MVERHNSALQHRLMLSPRMANEWCKMKCLCLGEAARSRNSCTGPRANNGGERVANRV
jgi:hypothetical protein